MNFARTTYAAIAALALAACNSPPSAPIVVISPVNPATDAELKATIVTPSTDTNGDPVALTFEWLKNNEKQTGLNTDTVPADKTTKSDVWTVVVTPSDGILPGPAGQASATIQNTPPTVSAVLDPATPTKNADLKIVPTATDADGDQVTFTYAWMKDGQTTTYAADTIPAAQLARGQKWGVTVTPNDGAGIGQPFNLSVDVANAKPVAPGVTLAPEKPTKATPIIASAQPGTDADGDAVQLKFAWTVDGKIVDGQTGAVLAPAFFAKNQSVTVIVTPNDGKDDGTPATTTINVVNTAPTVPAVSLKARPKDSDELVCSVANPSLDIDGDVVAYVFMWLKNEQPFNNAVMSGNTSTVSAADTVEGDTFSCSARATDGFDTSTASDAAVARVNAKPTLGSVALSPLQPTKATPIYAQPANPSDADSDTVRLNYSWLVAGNPVQGQTSSALAPTFFAKGQDVTVIVTPNDGIEDGTPALANVNVQNSPPTAPGVTLTQSPRSADPIVCTVATPSADLDGDPVSYSFAWAKNGQAFNGATTTGATSTIAPSHADGDTFACSVSATDGTSVVTGNATSATVASLPPPSLRLSFEGAFNDSSSNNFPVTNNGVTLTTDRLGNPNRAARFTGTNHVKVQTNMSISHATPLTITLWAKADSNQSQAQYASLISMWGGGCGGLVAGLNLNKDFGGHVSGRVGDNCRTQTDAHSSLAYGSWTHVAMSFDGTRVRLFLDGIKVAENAYSSGALQPVTALVRVGGEFGMEAFSGSIDEVQVFTRALDETSLRSLYAMP